MTSMAVIYEVLLFLPRFGAFGPTAPGRLMYSPDVSRSVGFKVLGYMFRSGGVLSC